MAEKPCKPAGQGMGEAERLAALVRARLEPELACLCEADAAVSDQLAGLAGLAARIAALQSPAHGRVERVDIGCGFLVEARIESLAPVAISIGFGFYVECGPAESERVIVRRTRFLAHQRDWLGTRRTALERRIAEAREAMWRLQTAASIPTE
jgi:prefoldin subunit 5